MSHCVSGAVNTSAALELLLVVRQAPPESSKTGAIAGGVVGGAALLLLAAAAAYFVLRRRRSAKAKDAGLPTVAPAARGGNGAPAPGPGTEDKDSAFAWQERSLLPVRRLCVLSCLWVVICLVPHASVRLQTSSLNSWCTGARPAAVLVTACCSGMD